MSQTHLAMGVELPDTSVGRALLWVLAADVDRSDDELAARFTDEFLAQVPPAQLRAHLEGLHRALGLISVESIVVGDESRLVVAIVGEGGQRRRVSAAVDGDPPRLRGLLLQPGRPPAPAAGSVRPDEVPDRIDALSRDVASDGAGCAIGVFRADDIVHAAGFGLANIEHGVPITLATAFRVGSVTKQFTAATVALLIEDGRLTLSTPLSVFVPEVAQAGDVAVRDLVHHTSGIRDFRQLLGMKGRARTMPFSDNDVIELLGRQRGLNFSPGTRFLYSNSNYFLLGLIVARITGSTLRAFAEERLFSPLGMSATHFHDDCQEVVPHRATGYGRDEAGGWRIEEDLAVETVGQGNLFTTIDDLAKWNGALVHRKLGGSTFNDLMEQLGSFDDGTPSAYGFGLMHQTYRGARLVSHAGATEGFRAEFIRFPDDGVGVACLVNSGSIDPTAMCLSVADIVLADTLGPDSVGPRPADRAQARDYAADGPPAAAITGAWETLAGRYYSHELDVAYDLVVDDGGLHTVLPDGRRVRLTNVGPASLEAEGIRLDFAVDANPPRFVAGGGRSFGIEFERLPSR